MPDSGRGNICFNGAATLSLRKSCPGGRGCSRSGGRFNGAATLSLRKYARATERRPQRTRFNGAATLSLRKSAIPSDDYTVDNASMEPQLYRCGNKARLSDVYRHIVASMEPQLYRCGNVFDQRWSRSADMRLQWSRNFIVAEISTSCGAPSGRVPCFNGAATLSLRKFHAS